MKPLNKPGTFHDYLSGLIDNRVYCQIQYFSSLRELITVDALIRGLTLGNDGYVVALSTGDQIPINMVIRAGYRFAPDYADYEIYCTTCDA